MENLRALANSRVDTQTISQVILNPQLSLSRIFQPSTEESKVLTTKRKLGETAKSFSEEQIECMVTDFQFLIDSWLDEFERIAFDSKTLQELLGEKAYADSKQK